MFAKITLPLFEMAKCLYDPRGALTRCENETALSVDKKALPLMLESPTTIFVPLGFMAIAFKLPSRGIEKALDPELFE